ncbi:MAG TPA: hypothetical protein VE754_02415 [Actinomycetota bacterium]|jgi:hypothetical protein|nr:hypothetical protein [Actinomycetota bacterium]
MGFKRGLIVGFGIGYVLGAKAGRERYEELKRGWQQFTGNSTVQSVMTRGREVVESGAEKSLHVVEEKVKKATGSVKKRLEGEEEEGWQPVKG